ncbi:hypothetical protein BRADI_5g23050v3 [Brachypodium distachyon]|uniref:Receptor-like serine/threonine-protein kinase n=1 Tax=Brachypodium distachyon TaxID=15368 RepID=A0A2K2CIR0_BRADI|nr:hypothetical protein BRADI_5g23050v3 [Brachypodium distachyon]
MTICIPILILLLLSPSCKSDDTLTHAKPLFYGEKLVSKGGDFALGFFSPASSNKSFYLGIWYNNLPAAGRRTVVWVTNRDKPIAPPSSAALAVTNSSDLVLSDSQGVTYWKTKNNITAGRSTQLVAALLLDEGNFVIRMPNNTIIWQSFDHPTDIILPKMSSSVVSQSSVDPPDELYFTFTVSDGSPFTLIKLDHTGKITSLSWNNQSLSWGVISSRPDPAVPCDIYSSCGPFGYCDLTTRGPMCACLDGFEPNGVNISSGGCRRKEALECSKEAHFVTLPRMKVPDKFLHIRNRSLDECKAECTGNCACTAYAYANFSRNLAKADPSRCLVWTGELIDTEKYNGDSFFTAGKSINSGEDLYLRLADSHGKNIEFPFVNFESIVAATNNFSDSNLIGRGGFGKVYKGMLEGGNEVAIKRLGEGSRQGIEEFKNEIVLFAKLQHRNLVRLLGCCIHRDERLLIYEYLPNKSLDAFLFDSKRQYVLDWPTRFKIVKGIARGLLYLHQDSRLTIIHRDLKTSNILLDREMNPKISDFGMARIFGENQQQANTTRVVGTYGYMSPEYVMGGSFSVKSDTYSFGVLLLEIISGSKISSPHLTTNFSSLTAYAWKLWEDGQARELVDCLIVESCPLREVLRCVHVGLLCVQDHPNDRPLMSSVIFILENENALLPAPKQPLYFSTSQNMENSDNAMSITTQEGR